MKIQMSIIALLLCISAQAQLAEIIEQRNLTELFFYQTFQRQHGASVQASSDSTYYDRSRTRKFNTWGIGIAFRRDRIGLGKNNFWIESRFVNDFMTTIWKHIAKPQKHKIDGLNDYPITSGLLGNIGIAWNINDHDKYRIMLGINAADYGLSPQEWIEANPGYSVHKNELFGLYAGIGPTVEFAYAISDYFAISISASINYNIPYQFGKSKGSLNPVILHTGLEVMSQWGFFSGLDYIRPMSSHDTQLSRLDLKLGWSF